jgi:cytidine deaminase
LSEDLQPLIEAAKKVAPFSNFHVCAAVKTESGKVYTGCNVESASYGLTVCAERVAIWKALSEGERQFTALAVVADTETLTPPCGTCRQIIWEFARGARIVFANLNGQTEEFHIADLLPRAFDARFLKNK